MRRAGAAGEQKKPDADDEEDEPGDERDRRLRQERPDDVRAGHDEIAEDAAKPVRQRPALRLGQGGESGREQQGRGGPGDQAPFSAVGRGAGHEMPTPGGKRQKQKDRRKSQRLDAEIRDDRAPIAQHVAGYSPGRIVQAGIVDGPGGEAQPNGASPGNQKKAVGAE